MARRRPSFSRGWSETFSYEPIDVYANKERERTVALVHGAYQRKYQDQDLPVLPTFGRSSAAIMEEAARPTSTRKRITFGGGGVQAPELPDLYPTMQPAANRQEQMQANLAKPAGMRQQEMQAFLTKPGHLPPGATIPKSADVLRALDAPAPKKQGGGGGGVFGRIGNIAEGVGNVVDRVTPDVLEGPARQGLGAAWDAYSAPQQRVGLPLLGLLSGATKFDREPVLDANGKPTGEYYRPEGSRMDILRGLGRFAKNPIRGYQENRQAAEEALADPELSLFGLNRTGSSVLAGTVSDPFTYFGPGAVRGVGSAIAKALPAAVRGAKGTRIAGRIGMELLANPKAAAVGGVAGATAGGEISERANLGPNASMAAILGGGVLGAMGAQRIAGPRGIQLPDLEQGGIPEGAMAMVEPGAPRPRGRFAPENYQGEFPEEKPTVKRANLFGDVEDTHQTEAELNGWRASQGALFDRGPAEVPSKPPPARDPNQRSMFDILGEDPLVNQAVPGEGNTIIRMRGDEIGEAIGADPALVRRYRQIDKSPKNTPEFAEREGLRKQWTEEYIRVNGRQPVHVLPPGVRETRLGEVEARIAKLREQGFTEEEIQQLEPRNQGTGSYEDYVPAASRERRAQLERIASDPNSTPEMRDAARRKMLEEAGVDASGPYKPREGGPPTQFGGDTQPVAQKIAEGYFGTGGVKATAARGIAGYVAAKAEGKDDEEAIRQALGMAAPGVAGRAGFRTAARGLDGVLAAVGDRPEGVKVQDDWTPGIKHSDITERPDDFQARNRDPGKTYSEARVQEILAEWDPAKLEPGVLVRDKGKLVLISGHHRLEAMKRKAAAGEYGDAATWRVFDADLDVPENLAYMQNLAATLNFTTAKTTMKEKLKAYRTLEGNGATASEVQDQLRIDSQEFEDLKYLRTLDDDLIDQLEGLEPGHQAAAATIAKLGIQAHFSDANLRAALNRYVFNASKALPRSQVEAALAKRIEIAKELYERGLQGNMFAEDEETLLRAIDLAKAKEAEILAAQRSATIARNYAASGAMELDPETQMKVVAAADAVVEAKKAELAKFKQGFVDAQVRQMAGEPEPPPRIEEPEPVEQLITQEGPGLFGEDLPPAAAVEPEPLPTLEPEAELPALEPEVPPVAAGGDLPPIPPRRTAAGMPGDDEGLDPWAILGEDGEPPIFEGGGVAGRGKGGVPWEEVPPGLTTDPMDLPAGANADFGNQPGTGVGRTPPEPVRAGAAETVDEAVRAWDRFRRPAALRELYERFTPEEVKAAWMRFRQPALVGAGPVAQADPVRLQQLEDEWAEFERYMPRAEGVTGDLSDLPPENLTGNMQTSIGLPAPEPLVPRGNPDLEDAIKQWDQTRNPDHLQQLVEKYGEENVREAWKSRHIPEAERVGDEAQARLREMDDAWASFHKTVESTAPPESGTWVNKALFEWPNKANRTAFTLSTTGDPGSGLIQGAYMAFANPADWYRGMRDSFQAFGSASKREGFRQQNIRRLQAAVPDEMKGVIADKVRKYGLALATTAEEMSGDLGVSQLEVQNINLPKGKKVKNVLGPWFRGNRRQFETSTEHWRTTAMVDQLVKQRQANIAKGLGDVIFDDQLKEMINTANHFTGATKMNIHPAASIAFGAPRFFFSQIALIQDALTKGGISGHYARVQLAKTFGMMTTATVVANIAQSGGKDWFGPGLGGPDDIESWEDFKEVITSPNFGRVRINDADVSLYGPMDPIARAFFKEVAAVPELIHGDFSETGEGVGGLLTGKGSPLVRAVFDVAQGKNKYTGEEINDPMDFMFQNIERSMPIWSQNAMDALEGRGSWTGAALGAFGLKTSPTTPYERATGVLGSLPGEYWVVDAKNNVLRPPETVWELTAEQRDKLRKEEPEIDNYLRQREDDLDLPAVVQMRNDFAAVQVHHDSELAAGRITTDQWRAQFIANQRQLATVRDTLYPETGGDREPTTQRQEDIDSYFAIWDSPEVEGERGTNYEAAELAMRALRSKIGEKRWDELKSALAWNKSETVTDYLQDMQLYGNFLDLNPKYEDVPKEATRRIDSIATRIRELQATNPGVPGQYILADLEQQGLVDPADVAMVRTALARRYSPEYTDWKATPEGDNALRWFRPAREGDPTDLAERLGTEVPSRGGGGLQLRARRGGGGREAVAGGGLLRARR